MVETVMVPLGNTACSDYFHLHVSYDLAHGLSQSFSTAQIVCLTWLFPGCPVFSCWIISSRENICDIAVCCIGLTITWKHHVLPYCK